MSKTFQELNLSDAFLFAAALEDEETCRMILEVILGYPVNKVTVRAEHSILYSSDFRTIRLDIYANEDNQVFYNLEMQNQDKKNLAKRSRYHQAEMDVTSLKPGEDFSKLKPGFVVFICSFDPFDRGFYQYTFENRCLEADFPLGDETRKIFFNTKGNNPEGVPAVLVNFLHYLEETTDTYVETTDDPTLRKIHGKVTQLKKSRELEERYMTFQEMLNDAREEGERVGEARGEARGTNQVLQLIKAMNEAGEGHLVSRLGEDPDFVEEMLEKYHLGR